MFCGATTCAWPTTSTTWKLTATALHVRQLANAYASLRLRTVSLSAHTSANETSYAVPPSLVTIAIVWLSPGPGAAGLLNGKTQVGPLPDFGVSTMATAGWSAVGNGEPSSAQTVRTVRCAPGCRLEVMVAGIASSRVPRS